MTAEQIADALTPIEALQLFPGRPSLQSLNRWILKGITGPSGQKIRLRSFRVAGRRYLTRDAIAEFITACNADPIEVSADSRESAVDGCQTFNRDAARRAEAADLALQNLGF